MMMMTRTRWTPLRTVPVVALALLAAATVGRANMAEPPAPQSIQAGSAAGELSGGLAGIRVVDEQLRIDLRPLAEGGAAQVEATYRLHNQGGGRELTLWFVAHALFSTRTAVELDGSPVASEVVPDTALPADWRVPPSTPNPDGGDPLEYRSGSERVIGFRVALPPGDHALRVRYQATAAVFQTRGLMPVRQLGYVLAPARRWGGFGTLDVRVELPRGWHGVSTPALRREGSALVGRFEGIPADALTLAVRAPEPAAGWRYGLVAAAALLATLGLGWGGSRMGRALGRRGRSGGWVAPVALIAALMLSVAVVVAWVSVPEWIAGAAGPMVNRYEISRMSYGGGFALVLVIPVVLLVSFLTMLIAGIRGARRARAAG